MKNIHLISTDKSSRLYYNNNDKMLQFCDSSKESTPLKKNRSIYITSSEEIKEGDWYINTFVSKREQKPQTHTEKRHLINHQKDYRFKYCKKIILTTDQHLIKDGVQIIDDEFLEWFVKNPSCGEVNTQLKLPWESSKDEYEIIIPKEEPKQHVELINDNIDEFDKAIELFKQETTLEEVAEKYVDSFEYGIAHPRRVCKNAFINGAKWQQERSYSEEEVKNIMALTWIKCSDNNAEDFLENRNEILKQFKYNGTNF